MTMTSDQRTTRGPSFPTGVLRPAAVLLLMGMALCACRSAPTRLFTLEPIESPGPPIPYQGPTIRVDAFHVPPADDRIELVTGTLPGQIEVHDTDEWSAPLVKQARQALSADLIARLPPGRVIFPHLVKPAGALGLSVDVLEFHADGNGASMQASWVFAGATGGPAAGGGTATLRIALQSDTPAGIAAAWSQLIGELADRIVDSIKS